MFLMSEVPYYPGAPVRALSRESALSLFLCLSLCLFICLSYYLPFYLSAFLSTSLSVCLSFYISIYLSFYRNNRSALRHFSSVGLRGFEKGPRAA